MCFHNSMSKKARELAARYGRKSDILEIAREILDEQERERELLTGNYRISGWNNPACPIINKSDEIQVAYWGLIPFWCRPKDNDPESIKEAQIKAYEIQKGTLNARSESLFDKPSYRYPIRSKRCLIPSTGYFEFHYEKGVKGAQPYYIYLPDEEIFSMGGIYDYWTDPETGEIIRTFSQITTPANNLSRWIHNGGKNPYRMPLIIPKEYEERWLDPNLTEAQIKELMKPYPEEYMDAYPVTRDFKDLNPKDEKIIEPAEV